MAEKKTLYAGCKAGTAMRIEEAGTGPSLKLTGSIFADYVQKEVFISATKFSGEEIGSYHLHHLMSRLNAIQVAKNILNQNHSKKKKKKKRERRCLPQFFV
jgi:hypothetical protein